MAHRKKRSAGERLKKWKESQGITLDSLVDLLGKVDATVSFDKFQLSRAMNDHVAPNGAQRTVIAIVTGIPEYEWLSPGLRRARQKALGA